MRALVEKVRRLAPFPPVAPIVGALSGVAVAAAIVFSGPLADAKASYESQYGYDRTWNAALRLVRVDLGLKVTEKDDAGGYLLFDYKSPESGDKITPGSMEIVRPREPGAPVHVFVQLPQMPRYHEQVLADELARKMRNEYGDPPKRAPAPSPPATDGDAGADGGE